MEIIGKPFLKVYNKRKNCNIYWSSGNIVWENEYLSFYDWESLFEELETFIFNNNEINYFIKRANTVMLMGKVASYIERLPIFVRDKVVQKISKYQQAALKELALLPHLPSEERFGYIHRRKMIINNQDDT